MITPLAHSITEVCCASNTGRTSVYEEIKKGNLRAIKRGRRTLILAEDLRHWLEALPSIAVKPAKQEQGGVP
jgi:excisionase family DNA binding protein